MAGHLRTSLCREIRSGCGGAVAEWSRCDSPGGLGHSPLMALKEAMKAPRKPPNLRRGTAKAHCAGCVHFRGGGGRKGKCALYSYPVEASQVCDSFRAKTPTGR